MATQVGLKVFEEAFKGFEDQYVLIGGSAAQLAMESAGEQFPTSCYNRLKAG